MANETVSIGFDADADLSEVVRFAEAMERTAASLEKVVEAQGELGNQTQALNSFTASMTNYLEAQAKREETLHQNRSRHHREGKLSYLSSEDRKKVVESAITRYGKDKIVSPLHIPPGVPTEAASRLREEAENQTYANAFGAFRNEALGSDPSEGNMKTIFSSLSSALGIPGIGKILSGPTMAIGATIAGIGSVARSTANSFEAIDRQLLALEQRSVTSRRSFDSIGGSLGFMRREAIEFIDTYRHLGGEIDKSQIQRLLGFQRVMGLSPGQIAPIGKLEHIRGKAMTDEDLNQLRGSANAQGFGTRFDIYLQNILNQAPHLLTQTGKIDDKTLRLRTNIAQGFFGPGALAEETSQIVNQQLGAMTNAGGPGAEAFLRRAFGSEDYIDFKKRQLENLNDRNLRAIVERLQIETEGLTGNARRNVAYMAAEQLGATYAPLAEQISDIVTGKRDINAVIEQALKVSETPQIKSYEKAGEAITTPYMIRESLNEITDILQGAAGLGEIWIEIKNDLSIIKRFLLDTERKIQSGQIQLPGVNEGLGRLDL